MCECFCALIGKKEKKSGPKGPHVFAFCGKLDQFTLIPTNREDEKRASFSTGIRIPC